MDALDAFEVSFVDSSEALDAFEALSDVAAAVLDDVLDEFDDADVCAAMQPVNPATRSIDTTAADRMSAILFMLSTFRFHDGHIGHSTARLPHIEHYSNHNLDFRGVGTNENMHTYEMVYGVEHTRQSHEPWLGETVVAQKGEDMVIEEEGRVAAAFKPKAQPAAGIALLCLDVILIAGLLLLPGPCAQHGSPDNVPSCYWACRASLGVAAIVAILAIVRIFETDEGARRGLSLACALLGVLVALMPGVIIELCADPTMSCNAIMRPFAIGLGVCIALVGGIDLTRRLLALLH